MSSLNSRYYLWERSVRIFHWSLVLLIIGLWITIKSGNTEWHGRLGIMVLGLLTFRIVLGFCGGEIMRFTTFLGAPTQIVAYLRGQWRGYGHNPLGAWSVLALLALLAWQATSGLFVNDDIAFEGPWVRLIDKSLSDTIATFHKFSSYGILILVGLHLAAIIFYAVMKKQKLLPPMIHGWKASETGEAPSAPFKTSSPAAVIFAIAIAFTVMVFAHKGAMWLSSF